MKRQTQRTRVYQPASSHLFFLSVPLSSPLLSVEFWNISFLVGYVLLCYTEKHVQNENTPLKTHSMNPSLLLFKCLIMKNQGDP